MLEKQDNPARAAKLTQLFWGTAKGERSLKTSNDAKNFLEACFQICKQKSPVYCVEVLISTTHGVEALSLAFRIDLSINFILSTTVPFLQNLTDPAVETLNSGKFLEQILTAVLVPTTFWSPLLSDFKSGKLDDTALVVFAWLSLHIVSSKLPDLSSHQDQVKEFMKNKSLLEAQSHEVRSIAYRIEKVINVLSGPGVTSNGFTPGGRHDNDFENFRQISIYPTTDEFLSTEQPFLQRLDDAFDTPMETRPQTHLDWLFRLLREDMLAELREDLQIAMGQKKGRRTPVSLGHLKFAGLDIGAVHRVRPCAVRVACGSGVNLPRHLHKDKKRKFLVDNKKFLKHLSFGVLCCGSKIVAFGTLMREVDDLLREPPVVGIEFADSRGLKNAIASLKGPEVDQLRFIIVDTATFAYEPILKRLKEVIELPLGNRLIDPRKPSKEFVQSPTLKSLLVAMKKAFDDGKRIKMPSLICKVKPIHLEGAQLRSLVEGLSGELGQIQGPPGTGKSFIGALMILIILRLTNYRVLILSYTNHALDQFIEDLMEIGVEKNDIVRLGSKYTSATEGTRLDSYVRESQYRLKHEEWGIINALKQEGATIRQQLEEVSGDLARNRIKSSQILDYLEFSDHHSSFWNAFQIPTAKDGYQLVGANNRALESTDLYLWWFQGRSANAIGKLAKSHDNTASAVWRLAHETRRELDERWRKEVRNEQIAELVRLGERSNEIQQRIESIFNECKRRVLGNKRVIASTTTAAAMYQSIIKTSNPDVVMVEEAGEILEAHVITALSPSVKQLILIGDHKQLRPKVNNYKLTIEKGEGFDLNVSLFERLIRQGNSYTALQEQHRSHPDISHFARILAYPDLKDVPSTDNRDPVRGLPSRVTFVHHEHSEDTMTEVGERRDPSSKGSKRNLHEAKMVLKMVRYLGQQGYKSENIVVLTPYLGQLALLRDTLRQENDPYLNDLDSHELLRAGLIPEAASKVDKKPLRLSTIDNYQGEESDLVVVSLTRSNANGDIGFLHARERLVVLMSRARSGIILFGNMLTFMKSKKGGEMWSQYFNALKEKSWVYDGVPVRCERHPDRSALLKKPEDFDLHCPDGGCAEFW